MIGMNMKNKIVLVLIVITYVFYMSSCSSENIVENGDYKKLKNGFEKYSEVFESIILHYDENQIDNILENFKDYCEHEIGYGYIKDSIYHTLACKQCSMHMSEPEFHSDVKTILYASSFNESSDEGSTYIYAKFCPVCGSERINFSDSAFFEYIITKKSLREFELDYGVIINE